MQVYWPKNMMIKSFQMYLIPGAIIETKIKKNIGCTEY